MAYKREWRPSPEEVRRIVEEMRPILRAQARRSVRLAGHPKLAG